MLRKVSMFGRFSRAVYVNTLLQLSGTSGLYLIVFGTPLVERGIAEASAVAQLLDRHDRPCLHQEPNDLIVAKSALLRTRLSPCLSRKA